MAPALVTSLGGASEGGPLRSEGMEARAYWTTQPGRGEIRTEALGAPGAGEAMVVAVCSGISLSLIHI